VEALMVGLIALVVWVSVLVVVVAFCKAAQAGDRAQTARHNLFAVPTASDAPAVPDRRRRARGPRSSRSGAKARAHMR
jgi:hypothetical protein